MYKKIVLKFIFFSFLCFLIIKSFAIYAYPYVQSPLKTSWQTKSKMSKNFKKYYNNYVIIGSSRALALNPRRIEDKTEMKFLNLSIASAKIPYVYYTLQRLIKSGAKIDGIYIDIPASNNMKASLKGVFGEKSFLSYEEVLDLSLYYPNAIEYYEQTRTFGKNYVDENLYKIFKDYIKYNLGKNENRSFSKKLIKKRGHRIFGDGKCTKEQALKYRKIVFEITQRAVLATQKQYLRRIINLLEKEKINFKFFFSAYPSESKKIFNLGIGNYIDLLELIPKEHRKDRVLILDESLFNDGSHVNLEGSKKFTDYFIQEVLEVDLNEQYETFLIKYD